MEQRFSLEAVPRNYLHCLELGCLLPRTQESASRAVAQADNRRPLFT